MQAAELRFDTKRHLIDWGRKERDICRNVMLSIASLDQVASETKYFRDQCIAYQLSELVEEYRDVARRKQPSNPERLAYYSKELGKLLD